MDVFEGVSNLLLETLYDDKQAGTVMEYPLIWKEHYQELLQSVSLSDIENELLARGYELEMSN